MGRIVEWLRINRKPAASVVGGVAGVALAFLSFGNDRTILVLAGVLAAVIIAAVCYSAEGVRTWARVAWTVFALLFLTLEAWFLDWHNSALQNGSAKIGALIQYAVPANSLPNGLKSTDGNLYFSVQVINVGGEPTLSDTTNFYQALPSRRFTPQEEDSWMASIKRETREYVKEKKINLKIIDGYIGLVPNRPHTVTQRVPAQFASDLIASIKSGRKFLYYGLVTVFTDTEAKRQGHYWYAEDCFLYDPIFEQVHECASQNTRFPRRRLNLRMD